MTMGNAKAVLSFSGGTMNVEGSEDFVRDCTARLTSELSGANANANAILLDKGIDHAWQWFSLHASHRMQAVNFFLVASTFLSAAYVSALHFSLPVVAAGVSGLGMMASVCFYLFELRIRELVKAAEGSLKLAQEKLAELTGVPALMICVSVEDPKYGWSYHKVIRMLYGLSALAFLLGFVYAFLGRGTYLADPAAAGLYLKVLPVSFFFC
jgi:hypothetical protein